MTWSLNCLPKVATFKACLKILLFMSLMRPFHSHSLLLPRQPSTTVDWFSCYDGTLQGPSFPIAKAIMMLWALPIEGTMWVLAVSWRVWCIHGWRSYANLSCMDSYSFPDWICLLISSSLYYNPDPNGVSSEQRVLTILIHLKSLVDCLNHINGLIKLFISQFSSKSPFGTY